MQTIKSVPCLQTQREFIMTKSLTANLCKYNFFIMPINMGLFALGILS